MLPEGVCMSEEGIWTYTQNAAQLHLNAVLSSVIDLLSFHSNDGTLAPLHCLLAPGMEKLLSHTSTHLQTSSQPRTVHFNP